MTKYKVNYFEEYVCPNCGSTNVKTGAKELTESGLDMKFECLEKDCGMKGYYSYWIKFDSITDLNGKPVPDGN